MPKTVDCHAVDMSKASSMLKALSNERRLQILCQLLEGERCVHELEKHIRISQSALSQHLAKLRQADLVTTRRNAQTIYYSIKDDAVFAMLSTIRDVYSTRLKK